ncbi:SDR family oxidoreductase [Frondihabitans cladoniiphilus]|uniref:SDR family oxidoreductase n=1 Tax=Frondihabitans cladoniiphilus TaxID=715785 RepID=A0ABP8VP56_9MICO
MTTNSAPFDGEKVVIIGGTSGFGLATAQAAAREGATVVVISRAQTSVDHALEQLPDSATGLAVDVRDEVALGAALDTVGDFDHLVFTAGDAFRPMPVVDTTIQDAKAFFDVRFWGAYASAKYGSPHIRPGGSIVLTAGTAGRRPSAGSALGASVSTAMEGLTRALALELAPVRVNLVIAGLIRTPLWDPFPAQTREAIFASTAARIPAGRVGEGEDIAAANLYLMHQAYATGTSVVVDGGSLLA